SEEIKTLHLKKRRLSKSKRYHACVASVSPFVQAMRRNDFNEQAKDMRFEFVIRWVEHSPEQRKPKLDKIVAGIELPEKNKKY
ncbi:hypothetical protein MAR_014371, partial [Mya arenaria]